MAATGTPTPNIGLRIPIGTDPASVDDINYNSNLLDTKLGAVGSDSVQDQIDTLNGKLPNIVTWTEQNISIGTSQYSGFYYGDLSVSSYSNKILAVTVVDYDSNKWATAMLINSRGTIRAWTNNSGGTVTVRIALKE